MTITHPSSGELKHITCKNPNEVHQALGWMMTNDGKSTAPLVASRNKAKLFAGGILQIRMQCYDSSTAYNLYYIASIGFTLAATRFALHQCKYIQVHVICATLNKMGINRNVSRHIIFDPKFMGGMALRHYLIGHIAKNDGLAKLMRICIEATQLEVGMFEPFFSLHGPSLVSRSWINEIWSFIEIFVGTITNSNTRLPYPQRLHDQSIM
jgi:hypothetical protein